MTTEPETATLKLYSPLAGELYATPDPYDGYREKPPISLNGEELAEHKNAILDLLENEALPEGERGLMTYFYGSDSVDEKVVSLFPAVEEANGSLFGVSVCRIRDRLSAAEQYELKAYCAEQLADGWGASTAHLPIRLPMGELHIHFWQPEGFYIKTAKNMGLEPPNTAASGQTGGKT